MRTSKRATLPAVLLTASLFALPALAQQSEVPPPPPPVPEAVAPVAPVAPSVTTPAPVEPAQPSTRFFGVSTGLSVGLIQLDAMYDHFYGFASTTLGVPLLSGGNIFVADIGAGYSIPISSPGESMWFFDLYAQVLPGVMPTSSSTGAYFGFGMGVGLRYLHRSGFTLGLKLPVFGMAVGDAVTSNGSFNGAASLGYYYLGNVFSSAPLTIGFRF